MQTLQYQISAATTEEETRQLGQSGFVKYYEMKDIYFYRKPKSWGFTDEMTHLKVLMTEKAEFYLVGDDDSGPEDAEDDLDLECASPQLQKTVNENRLFFQYIKYAIF